MREFLTKIEDWFAKLANRLSGTKEKGEGEDSSPKKPGIFDRMDAALARYDGSFLIWCFFLPAIIMLLLYVAIDVYPIGRNSVLVLDLNGQYIQFFAGLRAIAHGDGSLLYSFSRSLGGEFLGIYAYYLASPLSWIVAIFPEKNILEAVLVIFILKCGLSGLHMGIFLHYSRRPPKPITIALSILYALSSYVVVMQHNTMWIDGLMLLPLLMLGLERLIRERRPILYICSLALTLLCNYYIGYMMCIFTALYFFYYLLGHSAEITNPYKERYHFGASLLRVGLYTLVGIGLAAMLLLPAYYSLTFGKTGFTQGNFAFTAKFDIIDFVTKMFPGAYDTVRPEGLPWVYSGTVSLILFPLYFAAKKIPVREKIASGVIVFVIFLSMYINTLDVLWHGGQAPNWLNYRYSFVFIFLVLLLAARTLSVLDSVDYRAILAVAGILLLLVIILQKLNLTYTADGKTAEYFDDLNGVWLSIGLLVVYAVILLFLNGHDRTAPRYEPIATVLITVLCIEVLLNGIFYLKRQHEDVVISTYDSYHDFYDVYDDPFDYVKETDTSPFYRMDKTFQHTVCDSFVIGYRGLASSTSTLNKSTITFMNSLGMKAEAHWTEATGATIVSNAFLGVKYWVAKDGEAVDPLYTEYHRDGEGDAKTVTYKNPYALPLAFGSTAAIRDLKLAMPPDPVYGENNTIKDYGGYAYDNGWHLNDEWKDPLWSPFERLNAIYSALSGRADLSVYSAIEATITHNGFDRVEPNVWNHTAYYNTNSESPSKITLTFTPKTSDPVYFYSPSKYTRTAKVYVKTPADAEAQYKTEISTAAYVLSLGSFTPGEEIKVELEVAAGSNFYAVQEIPYLYTVNKAALETATALVSANGLVLDVAEDDYFEGSMTVKDGFNTVQTTIPYDAGWRITANGEEIEGYQTLDALLCFDLPDAGTYEITLRYRPTIYTVGLILSLVSFLILGLVITLIVLQNRRKLVLSKGSLPGRVMLFLLPPPAPAKKATRTEEADMGDDQKPQGLFARAPKSEGSDTVPASAKKHDKKKKKK